MYNHLVEGSVVQSEYSLENWYNLGKHECEYFVWNITNEWYEEL